MAEKFRSFYINHVPHQQYTHANSLASLAASLALLVRATKKVLIQSLDLYCPKFTLEDSGIPRENLQVKEVLETSTDPEPRDLRFSFIGYVLYGILTDDPKKAVAIRRKTSKFYYNAITRTLYRRSHDGTLLRCLSHKEAQEALKEAHDGCVELTNSDPNLGTDLLLAEDDL